MNHNSLWSLNRMNDGGSWYGREKFMCGKSDVSFDDSTLCFWLYPINQTINKVILISWCGFDARSTLKVLSINSLPNIHCSINQTNFMQFKIIYIFISIYFSPYLHACCYNVFDFKSFFLGFLHEIFRSCYSWSFVVVLLNCDKFLKVRVCDKIFYNHDKLFKKNKKSIFKFTCFMISSKQFATFCHNIKNQRRASSQQNLDRINSNNFSILSSNNYDTKFIFFSIFVYKTSIWFKLF